VEIQKESSKMLDGEGSEILATLLELGGSPGGARPKVTVGIKFLHPDSWTARANLAQTQGFHPWLIKFYTKEDTPEASIIEFNYMRAAAEVGIIVPDFHLFETKGRSYFGTKRFDVSEAGERFHLHSAAGMLHADFRLPALDYRDLLKLVSRLTRDQNEVRKMYQISVFNAVFHNRDDHAKNFSFLMDQTGQWRMSPAYDLTYSEGPGGGHSTSYLGEGKNISKELLLKLGKEFKIPPKEAHEMIERTREKKEDLVKELQALGLSHHPLRKFTF
jgi:serine/threonine-protein kinase HipA